MKTFFRISLLIAGGSLAFAGPKLAKDLPPGSVNGPADVIIQFKTAPTKDELKQLGAYGQVKKSFTSINAVSVNVAASVLSTLENDPNISYISPNRAQRNFLDLTTAAVGANLAWQYGWDGTGVG